MYTSKLFAATLVSLLAGETAAHLVKKRAPAPEPQVTSYITVTAWVDDVVGAVASDAGGALSAVETNVGGILTTVTRNFGVKERAPAPEPQVISYVTVTAWVDDVVGAVASNAGGAISAVETNVGGILTTVTRNFGVKERAPAPTH